MKLDALNLLDDAVAITNTRASTSVINQLSAGSPLPGNARFRCSVPVSITSGNGTGTLAIALETSAYEAFNSKTVLFSTAALAQADIVAGKVPVDIVIPPGALKYLRAYYTVATEDMTAGSIDAFITLSSDQGQDK